MKRKVDAEISIITRVAVTIEADIPDGITTDEYDSLCEQLVNEIVAETEQGEGYDVEVDRFVVTPPVVFAVPKLPPPPENAWFTINGNRYVTDGCFIVRHDVPIPVTTLDLFGRRWRIQGVDFSIAQVEALFDEAERSGQSDNDGVYDSGFAPILANCNRVFRYGTDWCAAWVDERGVVALVMSTTPGYADERKLCDWRGLPVNGGEK